MLVMMGAWMMVLKMVLTSLSAAGFESFGVRR
jgi:hypothetical protein